MKSGFNNKFYWFQTDDTEYSVNRFLNDFKSFFYDKFICVTAFDSGRLVLSPDELSEGWTKVNSISISPAYGATLDLPTAGFDEWYVFDTHPANIILKDIYVNDVLFDLSAASELTSAFWNTLDINNPVLYISEGCDIKVVTSDKSLGKEIMKYWC